MSIYAIYSTAKNKDFIESRALPFMCIIPECLFAMNLPSGISYLGYRTSAWDDLVMIVFSLVNDQGEKQSFHIEISDVVFQQLITTSNEDVQAVVINTLLSPNPVTNLATISFIADQNSEGLIQIYDNLGRVAYKKTIAIFSGKNKSILNLAELHHGAYTYTLLYNNTLHHSGKLIKT